MFTLYRAANTENPRAAFFVGNSGDTKPTGQQNGATFKEIDTGKVYRFDEENNLWYEGSVD